MNVATTHVDSMHADMGGTNICGPLKYILDSRKFQENTIFSIKHVEIPIFKLM